MHPAEGRNWKGVDEMTQAEIEIIYNKHIPAADVQEVKHGKWIRRDADGEAVSQCSVCKYPVSTFWNETNYCPNCGCRMDLEEPK